MHRKRNIQPETERQRTDAIARKTRAAMYMAQANDDRRSQIRHEAFPAPGTETVRLVDLSPHGCCLGFAAKADYRPGQFIRLGFAGGRDAVSAIVRWTEGLRVGAEFTQGLPADRIEAILGESANPLVGLL